MEALKYLDFDIQIERRNKTFIAQVLQSPVGEASSSFSLPFSEDRLENLLLKMGPLRARTRGMSAEEREAARQLGAGLFESVFSGEVLACLRGSLDDVNRRDGTGLRLRLRLQDVPELADLPWEFLFDRSLNRFLAQSNYTPVVRYVEMSERIRPLITSLPLRILVMISSPDDPNYPKLDVEAEKQRLQEALAPVLAAGKVTVDWLEKATLRELQLKLRSGPYHVFHYIGHGGFDQRSGEGVLVLEDELGRGSMQTPDRICPLLHDHRSLRLAVLNSCEGARNSRTDPFAGMAASLIRQGIPAVVAMQFEITDGAAVTFSGEFYSALAEGFPVDASIAEARKAILAQGNDIEWGTPVLYMRCPDGVLFGLSPAAGETTTAPPPIDDRTTPPVEPAPPERRTPVPSPARAPVDMSKFRLELQRKEYHRLSGASVFDLVIANDSAAGLDLSLAASDDDGAGAYRLDRQTFVPAESSVVLEVEARPRRRRWTGNRYERSFSLSADGGGGQPPASVSGRFDDAPRGLWPLAGGGLLGLGGIAAVIALLLLGGGGGGGSTTPDDGTQWAERVFFVSDRDGREEVYVMDADGGNQTRLTNGDAPSRLPDVIRYAGKVIFVSGAGETSELYVMDSDGGSVTRLFTIEGAKLEPSVSPDGTKLAFEVQRAGNYDIYVADISGANPVNLTRTREANEIDPSWSPDGERIVFASNRDAGGRSGVFEIYTMKATDGSDLVRVTRDEHFSAEPAWSPEGGLIAYESDVGGTFDIWITRPDGSASARVTTDRSDEFDPAWSEYGERIAFSRKTGSRTQVYVVNADGTGYGPLTNNSGNDLKPAWGTVPVTSRSRSPAIGAAAAVLAPAVGPGALALAPVGPNRRRSERSRP